MTAKNTAKKIIEKIKNEKIVEEIKSNKFVRNGIYAVLLLGVGAYLHALCTPDLSAMMAAHEPPYVLTRSLTKGDVSNKKKYIAKVEPINSVDVVPQVSGYLEKILFEDGAEIKAGDDIFIIEQTQYKADLEKAEASVEQLQKQYDRVSSLNQQKYSSDRELDIAESNLRQAKAELEIAKLNLQHSEIKAPISGIIGKALVTVGNYVNSSTGKLARIVQTDPIRIVFSITDKERLIFKKKAKMNDGDLYVDIVLPNGDIKTTQAKNIFVDNEVDATTATIPVYLDFENDDYLLVPGNYVDIYIRFKVAEDALLVPQQALMSDVNGTYVMAVNDENKVEQKYITLGAVMGENQEVKSGLKGDEKVIVQGLQKVAPGMKVNPNHLTEEKQGE